MRKYKIITILFLIFTLNINAFAKETKIQKAKLVEINSNGIAEFFQEKSVSSNLDINSIAESLPSQYSSVDSGFVSTPKNQGNYGICWSFATGSLVETYYSKIKNKSIDYSEIQQALRLTSSGLGLNSNGNGYWRAYYSGGNWEWSTSSLVNFGVKEESSNFPFYSQNLNYYISNPYTKEQLDNVPTVGLLDGAYVLSLDPDQTGCSSDALTVIKSLVYQYGSAGINIYWKDEYYNSDNNKFTSTQSGIYNHAVTVVGWDDSKQAFKVKNSWGTNFGVGGYFWVSYSSKDVCTSVLAVTNVDTEYDSTYNNYHYYNVNYNATSSLVGSNSKITLAEKYTKKTNGRKEKLDKIIFYALADTSITAYVNTSTNLQDNSKVIRLNDTPLDINYAGYYSIDVPSEIILDNDFTAYLEIKNRSGTVIKVPLEINTESNFEQYIIDNRWGIKDYVLNSYYTDSSYTWQYFESSNRLIMNAITETLKRATLVNDNGDSDTYIEFYSGMAMEDVTIPEKEGYFFLGYKDQNDNYYFDEDGTPNETYWDIDEDIVLTAVWQGSDIGVELYDNDLDNYFQSGNLFYSHTSLDISDFYTPGKFYTVSFSGDANLITIPSTYSKKEFLGYYTSSTGGVKIINSDLTFVPNTAYTDSNGRYKGYIEIDDYGDPILNIKLYAQYSSQSYVKLNRPDVVGYIIDFYTDSSLNNSITNLDMCIIPDGEQVIYYAGSPKTYNVLLNKNGGTYSSSTIEFTYDAKTNLSTIPTKTGYTFNGIYVNNVEYINNLGVGVKDWDIDNIENVEAVISWVEKEYTINLNYDSDATPGTISTTATYNSNVLSPSTITNSTILYTVSVIDPSISSEEIRIYTNSYASVNGFYYNSDKVIDVNSNNISLVQNITDITDSSSRWIRDDNITLEAHYNVPTIEIPTYTKAGYTCKLYNNDNFYTMGYVMEAETRDLVLTSQCENNTFHISFDLDGGETEYNLESGVDVIYTNTLSNLTDFITITKTGYTFLGFYYQDTKIYNSDGTSDYVYNLTENITVKARYQVKTYTITLDNSNADYYTTNSLSIDYTSSTFTPQTFDLPVKEYTETIFYTSSSNNSDDVVFSGGVVPTSYQFKGYYTVDGKKLINANLNLVNTENYIVNNKWIYDNDIILHPEFSKNNITLPKITKSGAICRYNTSEDGSGTNYYNGSIVSLEDINKFYIICENEILNEEAPVIRDNNVLKFDSDTFESFATNLTVNISDIKLYDNKGNEIQNPNSVNLSRNNKILVNGIEYSIIIAGDLDGDGVVSTLDAGKTIRKVLEGTSYSLDNDQTLAADTDGDGVVSTLDAGKVIRKVLDENYKIIKRREN